MNMSFALTLGGQRPFRLQQLGRRAQHLLPVIRDTQRQEPEFMNRISEAPDRLSRPATAGAQRRRCPKATA
jgi:hypothetical protein